MRSIFSLKKAFWLILILLIVIAAILSPTFFHGIITKVQASGNINSISPNNAAAGTTVTLQGTGFGATLKGKITLGGNVVSNFYTDSSGNFTQTFTIPSWANAGATTIVATNISTSASISFTVNSSSTVKTNRVNPMCVDSFLYSISNTDLNRQLNLMQQAGIKWTRIDFNMTTIEPTQGNFSWTTYDNVVNTAASYGVSIIAIIDQYNIPSWANNTSDTKIPPSPSIYQSYAQSIATHYSGKISLYEMGNEPNESGFWHPQWDAAGYTALLQAGYNGVKTASPNAKVISAGLSNESITNSTHSATMSFVQQMYASGAKGYFDYFAFHPYSQPHSPDLVSQTSTTFNVTSRIKTLLEQEGDKNKQIMITEVGWPTTSDFSGGGVTEASQAAYISRVFTKVMHEDYQYVPIACIFDLANTGTDTTNNQQMFGTVNHDYSQKSSYTSLQNAASDFSSNFTEISP